MVHAQEDYYLYDFKLGFQIVRKHEIMKSNLQFCL